MSRYTIERLISELKEQRAIRDACLEQEHKSPSSRLEREDNHELRREWRKASTRVTKIESILSEQLTTINH